MRTAAIWSSIATNMSTIHAMAAGSAGGKLEPFEYQPGPLGSEQVEIQVISCGICHSDLSEHFRSTAWG